MRSKIFRLLFGRRMKPFADIPGPEPTVPLGNGGDFSDTGDEPWLTFRDYVREYGALTVCWFGWSPRLVVGDPELLEQILGEHTDDYYKKDPVAALLPVLGDSAPFLANGARWPGLAERDLPNMPGVTEWLASQLPVVRATTRAHLDALVQTEPMQTKIARADATAVIRALGFAVFTRMAIGDSLPGTALAELLALAQSGTQRMNSMLPARRKLPVHYRQHRESWLSRFRSAVASARRELADDRTDMLATSLRQGTQLDHEGLALSLSNLYFGGMFSSCTSLQTGLWHLTRHSEVASALADEVRPLVGGDNRCTWAQLDSCELLDSCVREILRVDAPVPVFMRNTNKTRAIALGRYTIPKDTTLYISSWAMHRDERHWERPDEFDPHRWTAQVKAANPYGSGRFFPFGMGARACTGQAFALLFLKATLAEIVCNYQFRVGANRPYQSKLFFAVQAPYGWDCQFSARS